MDNIALPIDPNFPIPTPSTATPLGGPTGILPAHLDYTSAESTPVPPYMPIQGTRRTNGISQPEKKKKTKDKCTHQWSARRLSRVPTQLHSFFLRLEYIIYL